MALLIDRSEMGKNCIINGFFFFTTAKWIFNEMGIFTKWIYVKLAIAFFFFFFFFLINYQRTKKKNDIFYLIF